MWQMSHISSKFFFGGSNWEEVLAGTHGQVDLTLVNTIVSIAACSVQHDRTICLKKSKSTNLFPIID